MYSNSIVFICALVLLAAASVLGQEHNHDNHDEHKVKVDVYYESLCPDSKKFINSQLYVTLQNSNISRYINLTLIPFGKSTSEKLSENDYQFTCHHGPQECKGNKIHACALTEIKTTKDGDMIGQVNKIQAAFINCLMRKAENKDKDTEFPITECASLTHVNNVAEIETCYQHTKGSEKLYYFGEKTKALQPALSSVPTIVFNGKYNADDSKLAQENFVKALCKYIHGEKPAECSLSGSPSLQINLMLVTVLSLFATRYYF